MQHALKMSVDQPLRVDARARLPRNAGHGILEKRQEEATGFLGHELRPRIASVDENRMGLQDRDREAPSGGEKVQMGAENLTGAGCQCGSVGRARDAKLGEVPLFKLREFAVAVRDVDAGERNPAHFPSDRAHRKRPGFGV